MFLTKIKDYFFQNRRSFYLIGAICIVFFLSYQYGFADTPQSSSSNGDLGTNFIKILGGGLKIVASLLGVLTAFVALFLNPEWTSGTAFGLQNHLKEIWILVSNVIYFIFALILIVIAIMNIMNAGDTKWELKQALPRFIVGVLIVPFSWFFVQFVVSVSAILTIGVLTLPYDTFKNEDFFTNIDPEFTVCTHQIINLGSSDTNNSGEANAAGEYIRCDESSRKTVKEILEGNGNESGIKNGVFGIISIYTYGIMGVDGMDVVLKEQLTSIKALLDLGVKGIFDLIFVIVYVLLMAALFLALFTRGVWLWMYMMLSPAFGLLYFFDKTKEGMGESGKSFNVKEFLSLALVPVYVSAALSFGLVFLFVAANGVNDNIKKDENKETIDLVGLKLTIEGYQGKTEGGMFGGAQGALSTIIVEMFGIVILWIAVMAALKTSETTGAIIKPISDFGGSVGNLVKSAPMYAPIIPTPGGGMQSAASLQNIGSQIEAIPRQQAQAKGSSFVRDTFPSLSGGIELGQKSMDAMTAASTLGPKNTQTWSKFRDAIKAGSTSAELAGNKQFMDLLTKLVNDTEGSDDTKKAVNDGGVNGLIVGLKHLDEVSNRGDYSGYSKGDLIGGLGKTVGLTPKELDRILASGDLNTKVGEASSPENPSPTVNNSIQVNLPSGVVPDSTGKLIAASGKTVPDIQKEIADSIKTELGEGKVIEKDSLVALLNGKQITNEEDVNAIIISLGSLVKT